VVVVVCIFVVRVRACVRVCACVCVCVRVHARFINARRRVLQPIAAAATAAANLPTDSHESSAAKRMKTMLQSENLSQFWSPMPRATSVGYSGHPAAAAAAMDEAHSLSSTPSSTVCCACIFVCMLQFTNFASV